MAASEAAVAKRQRPRGASDARSAAMRAGGSFAGSKLTVTSCTRCASAGRSASAASRRPSAAVAAGQASGHER